MQRLSSLGSRHLAHRKGRSALTAAGIVLGVAILFGVLVSNATTRSGVDRLIADFTGAADVVVRATGAFDATIPEAELAKLRALPNVRNAVGSYGFESSLSQPGSMDPEAVLLRGVRIDDERKTLTFKLIEGREFVSGAAEILITEKLLDANPHVKLFGRVRMGTPTGARTVQVVGVLANDGAARANQGDVAFTSVQTARAFASEGAVFSSMRLVLDTGVDIDAWIEQHRRAGLHFENAGELAAGFTEFLDILGSVFTFFAAITLFVGAFLIYLTLSMAVIERTRVYGTMRALGATRAQIRRIVVAEAIVLGTVSTLIGLALGLAIAKGLIMLLSNLFGFSIPGLTVTSTAIAAGVVTGLATTIASSLVPAFRASALSPVVAMKGDHAREARLSRAWVAGLALMIAGAGLGLTGTIPPASVLIMLGAVLLTPLLLRPLARLLGLVTNRLARGVGDIAVLHLVKERSRSAYTLALIMVVMAVIFAVGAMNATLQRTMDEALDVQFGADLHVGPFGDRFGGFVDPAVEQELRTVPDVDAITGIRFAQVRMLEGDGGDTFARIIDPSSYFDVAGFVFADGSANEAERALSAGGAILMEKNEAAELGKGIGDTVTLETARGPRRFRIAATISVFAGPREIVLGLKDGRAHFNAQRVSVFEVNLRTGAEVRKVADRIEAGLGRRYNIEVETAASIKSEAQQQFGRFFNIFYAILLVAAVVGLLGLANTLAMSVLQRYREIGVLRAIGTTRGQVRRMVLVESATLGAVAFALSLPLGWLLSNLTVRGIGEVFAFDVEYVYPAGWIPGIAMFGIAVAVLAAIAPGRRAARLEVVSALQYE